MAANVRRRRSESQKLVGYALYFYTYSSFLAKRTLYLEDIFVLEEHRKMGVGLNLFMKCISEAARRDCGRMEWAGTDVEQECDSILRETWSEEIERMALLQIDLGQAQGTV